MSTDPLRAALTELLAAVEALDAHVRSGVNRLFDAEEQARAALAQPVPDSLTVIRTHAPRATVDGELVCAEGDFDGTGPFEEHVASRLRDQGSADR